MNDDAVRTFLCEILVRSGHTVIAARDGVEGLELFPRTDPDLVITDLVMPKKDGLEVMRTLREKEPRVKIIAMSAGDRGGPEDILHTAKEIGAAGVLRKPFAFPVLLAAINEVLGARPPNPASG